MAYNETLAERVRGLLAYSARVAEKKMMGGLTFMVDDKMCLGVLGDDLMVRIDPAEYNAALQQPGCREMTFTGRAMKGFVFVAPDGTRDPEELQGWVDMALRFNPRAKSSKRAAS